MIRRASSTDVRFMGPVKSRSMATVSGVRRFAVAARTWGRGTGAGNPEEPGGFVVAVALFETGDQFGTASAVRRANQYVVEGSSPVTSNATVVPA